MSYTTSPAPLPLFSASEASAWGLASMQEQGKGVGGKIAVWSEVDSGTEVELTIPASIAYAKSTVDHESTKTKSMTK